MTYKLKLQKAKCNKAHITSAIIWALYTFSNPISSLPTTRGDRVNLNF